MNDVQQVIGLRLRNESGQRRRSTFTVKTDWLPTFDHMTRFSRMSTFFGE